jgi:hypothetical protein
MWNEPHPRPEHLSTSSSSKLFVGVGLKQEKQARPRALDLFDPRNDELSFNLER